MPDFIPIEHDPFAAGAGSGELQPAGADYPFQQAAPAAGNIVDPASQYRSPWADSDLAAVGSRKNLLERARDEFALLKNVDLNYAESFQPGASKLEFWPPGEPGTAERPRPSGFAMDRPGVEVYSKDTRPIDIAGDVVSHHLIDRDPRMRSYYEQFATSLSPKQRAFMRELYDYARQHGEKRSYDDWETRSGMPAYFRGYAFQQWRDPEQLYTAEQRGMFDEMMRYLRTGRPSRLQPVDHDPFAGEML